MNIKVPPLFTLLITLSASIFYFMQNEDNLAIDVLFIGLYVTLSLFFLLKLLFYFKYKATLNELFFFLFVNTIALLIVFVTPFVPLTQDLIMSFNIDVIFDQTNENFVLGLTNLSLLALPYFIISSSLQIRCFTKYEFIRFSPTSEKGPKADWFALVIFFIFGALFAFIGLLSADILSIMYGIFYLFSGIGFLLGK